MSIELLEVPRNLLFLIVSLLLLSACATINTPAVSNQQRSNSCSAKGEIQSSLHAANAPQAQGNWPTFRGDLSRDGAVTGSGGSRLTLAWTYCTGGSIFSSPVVSDGVVYIASTDTTLTALDIRSARVLWQMQGDSAFFSSPALQDGVLYAGTLDGALYAVDARSGRLRWQAQVRFPGAKLWSSPAVAAGLVIIGTASTLNEKPKIPGQVLAFDAATGRLHWCTFMLAGSAPGGGVWSSPAIDVANSVVYVGTGDPDDGVQALSLRDGHLLWHWRSVIHDVADTDVGAGPLLHHDRQGRLRVVVGGKDGNIYSLDAANGRPLWHTHIGDHVFSSPALADGTLYVVGVFARRAVSWALDAQTGKPHWQHAISMIVYASPSLVGQTLYLAVGNGFGPGDGGIEVLNASNGHLLQYANIHSTATSSPAVLPSWLFVGANDGNLYAFVQ